MSQRLMQGRRSLPKPEDYGAGKTYTPLYLARQLNVHQNVIRLVLVQAGICIQKRVQSENVDGPMYVDPSPLAVEAGWLVDRYSVRLTEKGKEHFFAYLMRDRAK